MAKEKHNQRPAFTAPLYAALRQGTKELAQALPALPSSIRPVEETGTLGNPTQQMVTDQMRNKNSFDRMLDAYVSKGHEPSAPDQGMDR